MKFSVVIVLVFLSSFANSQTRVEESIAKNIGLNLNTVPPSAPRDTCYYLQTLLKVKVSHKSKIESVMFSDNAPDWLVQNLKSIYSKIDLPIIENVLKEEEIQNADLIFPFVIQTTNFPCNGVLPGDMRVTDKYFQFENQNLCGKLIFYKKMEFSFYPIIGK